MRQLQRATNVSKWAALGIVGSWVALVPATSHALQPLPEFVASARSANFDQREAAAVASQRAEEGKLAWADVTPTLTARAGYTRNQYDAVATLPPLPGTTSPRSATITPLDQFDASIALSLPLIDIGTWLRIDVAETSAKSANERVLAAELDSEKAITRAFYQVVAADATIGSAERALATAKATRDLVTHRREAGAASELDVERARAAVERAAQVVAAATQGAAVARRSLETISGLTPSSGTIPVPTATGDETIAPVNADVSTLPSVRAASLDAVAAEQNAKAAYGVLAPTLTGTATERFTNATGFSGHEASYAVGVTAAWTLDATAYFAVRSLRAGKAAADVRVHRAERAAKDALFTDLEAVKAETARSRAARAEAEASSRAAKLARDRFENGAATQLDVLTAERDAFAAEVAQIQTEADLALARAVLRVDSGATLRKDGVQ